MKKRVNLSVLFYIYLIGAALFIILGPEPKKVGGRGPVSKEKMCSSNIRLLMGAVEMYNMDSKTSMSTFDQRLLIKEKYLKSTDELKCPLTESDGTYLGTNLTSGGEIICSYHGSLNSHGKNIPKIKKSKKQIEYERKKYSSDCKARIPYALFWPLFSYPDGLTTFCK